MGEDKPQGLRIRALAAPADVKRLIKYVSELGGDPSAILETVVESWYQVELPGNADWLCAFRLVPQDGQPVVAEVRVFPASGADNERLGEWSGSRLGPEAEVPIGGLTKRALEKVPFRPYKQETRKILTKWAKAISGPVAVEILDTLGIDYSKRVIVPSEQPTKASGFPNEFYAELAAEYVEIHTNGNTKPVEALASRRGWRTATTRDRIHTARRRGFLTKAPKRGVAGGHLTPKAYRLLKSDERTATDELDLENQ